MNVFKLCELMETIQKHQKFLKNVIMKLLKDESKHDRKRQSLFLVIMLLKSL